MDTPKQAKTRTLAKEALKLVKSRAPSIVNERIIPQMLDEVAEYTGDIMGKLANLPADDDTAVTMAHGIIYDGLMREVIDQVRKTMMKAADKRITKLFKK